MGIKGDKLTQGSVISAEILAEKLGSIDGVSTKKMFGGHGVFHKGKMFGIINSKGQSFLKIDESSKADFEKRGSHQHSKMPYFSIPEEIMNNQEMLIVWAKKSIEISK